MDYHHLTAFTPWCHGLSSLDSIHTVVSVVFLIVLQLRSRNQHLATCSLASLIRKYWYSNSENSASHDLQWLSHISIPQWLSPLHYTSISIYCPHGS